MSREQIEGVPIGKGVNRFRMNYKKALVSAAAGVSLLLNAAMPAFAGTSLIITGNGDNSNNEAEIEIEQKTSVTQTNDTTIKNDVDAVANSGGNTASRNTGGTVTVDTGDAKTDVKVSNVANNNEAQVDCCMSNNDVEVLIEGNGADTKNEAELEIEAEVELYQTNTAKIDNDVDANADSGSNKADRNTGGDVTVETGKASTFVDLATAANSNSARISGQGGTGSLTLKILDNGADSENEIELELEHEVLLTQANNADVNNDVDADANSGWNRAKRNTGGNVTVDTGDAKVDVEVDNMVNFNWADVDCGCLFDVLAKVADNGADSENEIEAELEDELSVFQDNSCGARRGPQEFGLFRFFPWFGRDKECVDNDIDAYAGSGDNRADRNTGESDGDPSVLTGGAEALIDVENTGGSNVYGAAPDWEWPSLPEGLNVSISLDLHALLVA
ncbi:MAG: hypothetical protein ACD_52C00239G0001, partial [uncultured bacterium]